MQIADCIGDADLQIMCGQLTQQIPTHKFLSDEWFCHWKNGKNSDPSSKSFCQTRYFLLLPISYGTLSSDKALFINLVFCYILLYIIEAVSCSKFNVSISLRMAYINNKTSKWRSISQKNFFATEFFTRPNEVAQAQLDFEVSSILFKIARKLIPLFKI